MLAGCGGPQSALDPAGRAAERMADVFWWMTAGATLIWLAVVGLAVYAVYAARPRPGTGSGRLLIIGGGVVAPTIVLGGLLSYGLAMLPDILAPAPEASLRIQVTGEQWWWRVRYLPAGGEPIDLGNEIHLPVGEPVEFLLDSHDVIHSFWIPALGGKVDMIPGRRNRLTLQPTRTGVFRGACAEYCGASHALMSFAVVVEEKAAFASWLALQAQPARPPADPLAATGRDVFLASGCGACHTIRGTGAAGVVGPDLTHVGGRRSLAAGTLGNEPHAFHRWIALTAAIKPGARMPAFGMVPAHELRALAAYLDGLQ
jgi:cytochrome c oxidase subunit 2